MDVVFLEGLEIPCRVGCTEKEREYAQSLRVDIRFQSSKIQLAGKTDDLSLSIDYTIARELIAAVAHREFKLIETVAETLAQTALLNPNVEAVWVDVRKRAPVESLAFSGVSIERRRGALA